MAANKIETKEFSVEAKAQARFVRVTPTKARRVVDLVRGKNAQEAISVLTFAPQGASEQVLKVLNSAIANARQKADQASRQPIFLPSSEVRGR